MQTPAFHAQKLRDQAQHLMEPGGLERAVRLRLSPQRAFVDVSPRSARSLYVAGSRRSGTTWLAQMLADSYRCRLVHEPLRCDHVPGARWFSFGRYVEPDEERPEVSAFVGKVLQGRLRSTWSDRANSVRVARRRVVKDVWQNPLVPWMARSFPDMPIVVILRHPIASAWSVVRLKWDVYLEPLLAQPELWSGPLSHLGDVVDRYRRHPDPLVPHVLRWCIENSVLLGGLEPTRAHVVFFEDLALAPEVELAGVDRYLGGYSAERWRLRQRSVEALSRPSFTDYRGTAASAQGRAKLDAWRHDVPAGSIEQGLEVVAAFGLDRIYGPGPLPVSRASEVLGHPAERVLAEEVGFEPTVA